MARLVSVGFTKNPRQLTAKANAASAAKAQVNWSFDFNEGIVTAPWARPARLISLPTGLKKL